MRRLVLIGSVRLKMASGVRAILLEIIHGNLPEKNHGHDPTGMLRHDFKRGGKWFRRHRFGFAQTAASALFDSAHYQTPAKP
jgi:hypothetical protein